MNAWIVDVSMLGSGLLESCSGDVASVIKSKVANFNTPSPESQSHQSHVSQLMSTTVSIQFNHVTFNHERSNLERSGQVKFTKRE